MNHHAHAAIKESPLVKRDAAEPALKTVARDGLVIKAGTVFAGRAFIEDTSVPLQTPEGASVLVAGADYLVTIADGAIAASLASAIPSGEAILGGFHFAPGGNAPGTAGGDDVPAINPCSIWDVNFRPACPDPRGMTLVTRPHGAPFWCDIYLTGAIQHLEGTSKCGATIADGHDRPVDGAGKKYKAFDYAAACAVMAAHGKGLLSAEEFFAAAYGVTERSAAGDDPEVTGLDAARTSRFGLMQATGNLWVWGHDGHPEIPRASILGGSWFSGEDAGSRDATLGYWPVYSDEILGARGRSDHLQLD